MSRLPTISRGTVTIYIDNSIPRYQKVKRSWLTRLFTRPWKPLQSFILKEIHLVKTLAPRVYMMNIYTYDYLKREHEALKAKWKWDNGEDIPDLSKQDH
jgi:hypothetical protein